MSDNTNSFGIYDAPIFKQNVKPESLVLTPAGIEKQIEQGAFFMDLDEACKEGLISENDNIVTVSVKGA